MKTILFVAITLALSTSFISASAQTNTPVVRHRQVHQQARIHQGVKNGELTHAEARHLEAREAKIQHDKRMAKSDGVVTPSERRKLRREQNRSSAAIYRQKHDAQVRRQ